MPKVFTSKSQKIGELGENLAVRFLLNKGFTIKERNYTKKWGEIDIVAEKKNKIYFIEVKSVSRGTTEENKNNVSRGTTEENKNNVSHETYRPEENMHPKKVTRFFRTVQTYLSERRIEESIDWQIDLILVYIDLNNKKSKVKVIENIIS